MEIRDVRLSVTTDINGAATTTSDEFVMGRLIGIEFYISGMDAGSDFVVSMTDTPGGVDRTLFTLTSSNTNAWFDVRGLGAKADASSSGEYVHPLAIGSPKVVVAQGGNATSGYLVLYFETE